MHTYQAAIQPARLPAVALISTVLLGTGSVYGVERAELWRHHLQPRVSFVLDEADAPLEMADEVAGRPDVRTPAEHIENIRSVLNPSVSDLAAIFDVSRQAIYKWLSSDSTPEAEKIAKIVELSRIADEFRLAGVSRAGSLLKMKTFGGQSLMELMMGGQNRADHVAALIAEAKAMEASYASSGLSASKAKPTNDWQSSVSIPGATDRT